VGYQQQALTARPAPGTRPRNRRRLIIDAAADLFSERGYSDVAMSEVADAVAIGPSALYRHFAGKNDLLATVIEDALSSVDDALKSADTDSDIAAVLAGVVLDRRSVGVLWRREARHLSARDRKRLRTIARRIGQRLGGHVRRHRPDLGTVEADLLTWCALGVANSVSFHNLSLPEPGFAALLSQLIAVPLRARPTLECTPSDGHRPVVAARSRREAILAAATTLFAEKGFAGTSIDDIGAAVGIAGPSVYNHFAAKTDILAAAMFRGNEWLWMDFNRAVEQASNPADALSRVVDSYRTFAFINPQLVELLLSEASHLPEDEGQRAKRAQRDYVDEWVHLARQIHPAWTATEARIRVQACQMMINDVVVIRRLRRLPEVEAALADIGTDLLGAKR
jgi:AcrR family transcriptional regulator